MWAVMPAQVVTPLETMESWDPITGPEQIGHVVSIVQDSQARLGISMVFALTYSPTCGNNQSKTIRFDDRLSLERARHELKKKRLGISMENTAVSQPFYNRSNVLDSMRVSTWYIPKDREESTPLRSL